MMFTAGNQQLVKFFPRGKINPKLFTPRYAALDAMRTAVENADKNGLVNSIMNKRSRPVEESQSRCNKDTMNISSHKRKYK